MAQTPNLELLKLKALLMLVKTYKQHPLAYGDFKLKNLAKAQKESLVNTLTAEGLITLSLGSRKNSKKLQLTAKGLAALCLFSPTFSQQSRFTGKDLAQLLKAFKLFLEDSSKQQHLASKENQSSSFEKKQQSQEAVAFTTDELLCTIAKISENRGSLEFIPLPDIRKHMPNSLQREQQDALLKELFHKGFINFHLLQDPTLHTPEELAQGIPQGNRLIFYVTLVSKSSSIA